MSTIIDLSERVAAAEEVAQKSKDLEDVNTELSHFAYSASHDLKAPLSTVIGLLRFCIEDLEQGNSAEVRENLGRALGISKRSSKKVESILQIARAGREPVSHEPVILEQIVLEIWADLIGTGKSSELRVDFAEASSITTERPTLSMIIENLLSNALRYSDPAKPKHVVRVKSHVRDKALQIVVSDNGVGISEENKSKVFDMFRRLDARSGDGLGLALVKKQVDRLGGTIIVESEVGAWTDFTLTLPNGGS